MDDPIGRLRRRRALLRLAAGAVAGTVAGMARLTIAGAAPLTAPAAQDNGDQSIALLFVQTAAAGGFVPASGAAGAYTLTLRSVSAHTVYFADHPGREVGLLPTESFGEDVSFDPADPPNAALVVELDGGERAVAVLELRVPRYEAATHALSYDAAILAAEEWELPPTAPRSLTAEALPASFGSASLFIDPVNYNHATRGVGIWKFPPRD
jgi:hypothetical protein